MITIIGADFPFEVPGQSSVIGCPTEPANLAPLVKFSKLSCNVPLKNQSTAMKGTGTKRNVCPGSCVSTGATFPVAPVESAPMVWMPPKKRRCKWHNKWHMDVYSELSSLLRQLSLLSAVYIGLVSVVQCARMMRSNGHLSVQEFLPRCFSSMRERNKLKMNSESLEIRL